MKKVEEVICRCRRVKDDGVISSRKGSGGVENAMRSLCSACKCGESDQILGDKLEIRMMFGA